MKKFSLKDIIYPDEDKIETFDPSQFQDHPMVARGAQDSKEWLFEKPGKDWREVPNVVSAVKRQGGCGACWAFTAAGLLEGAYGIKTNRPINFSVQQLLDCGSMWGDKCKGGFVSEALEFGRYSNLAKEEYYPYQERDGICRQRGLEIYP